MPVFWKFAGEDKAVIYGIAGGTPQYLLQMNDQLSIEENVKNTFLNPTSAMFEEPENLLSKADLDLKLKSAGVKWLRPHFENDYGMKPDEFELEGEGKPVDAPSPRKSGMLMGATGGRWSPAMKGRTSRLRPENRCWRKHRSALTPPLPDICQMS